MVFSSFKMLKFILLMQSYTLFITAKPLLNNTFPQNFDCIFFSIKNHQKKKLKLPILTKKYLPTLQICINYRICHI